MSKKYLKFKSILRNFIPNLLWLIRFYKKFKLEMTNNKILTVKILSFFNWHSGFLYFEGTRNEDKIFIKVCSGKYDTNFNESKFLKKLSGESFPKKIFYKKYSFCSVLVIEYIEGISLDKIDFSKNQGLFLKLTSEILNILDTLYELKITHNDLNKKNIIYTGKKFLLIDFGWATFIKEDENILSNYPYIAKIINYEYRKSESTLDDAYSAYKMLYNINIEESNIKYLKPVEDRIGILIYEIVGY